MKSVSRRSAIRDLGALTAAGILGRTKLLRGQPQAGSTPSPDPFSSDITVFLLGPWLFLSKAPDRPNSILAITCNDPMHEYVHGIYKNQRPSTTFEPGQRAITVQGSALRTGAATKKLFADKSNELLCIDDSCGCIALSKTLDPSIRKLYLPIPDEIIPVVFVLPGTGAPWFQWPDAPKTQVIPSSAATSLILRYKNTASLSIDGRTEAKRGDHYHFEVRFRTEPDDTSAHIVDFSKRLARLLTYNGKPLDLSFDPGTKHPVFLGVPPTEVNPAEVGLKTILLDDVTEQRLSSADMATNRSLFDFELGDCGGAILTLQV